MKNQILILGSGSSLGVPRIDGYWGNCDKNNKKNIRTRCSAIITKGNNNILIDTSPDLRQQFLQNKILNVSYVIYTHEHSDQTNGLFELRPFTFTNQKIFDFWNKKGVLKLKPENRFKIFNYKNLEIFKLNSPNWYKNQNLISVNTKLFILNKKTKKFIKINENHLMKYFDLKKIKYELKKNNFKFLEWVEITNNKKKLDNCWSVLVIAKKIS